MEKKFRNMLAEKPTHWPIWFIIFPLSSIVVPSFILGLFTGLPGIGTVVTQLSPLLQFIVALILLFAVVTLITKRKPTSSDMGFDTKTLTKKNILLILAVFVITHAVFILIAEVGGLKSNAAVEFTNGGFGKDFLTDLILIIAGTIFAPVFEELIYRGFMLRAAHDGMLKYFPKSTSIFRIPAIFAIVVVAIAFIMPHVTNMSVNLITVAYFITSAGFSIVYLLTRSMTLAMVSHSLQSCFAFSQTLVLGHGDYQLSPIIYAISFLCPIIVYFIGTGMQKFFNRKQ